MSSLGNIRQHHIPATPASSLCGNGVDSNLHALFLCPFIRPMWKSTVWYACLDMVNKGSLLATGPGFVGNRGVGLEVL